MSDNLNLRLYEIKRYSSFLEGVLEGILTLIWDELYSYRRDLIEELGREQPPGLFQTAGSDYLQEPSIFRRPQPRRRNSTPLISQFE